MTLERDQLIVNHMPLADKLAWMKNRNTPKCVDIDELKSAAYMGLVNAANHYDEKHGVTFGTYARFRIIGEMSDYLRGFNWGGRKAVRMVSIDTPIEDSSLAEFLEGEEHYCNDDFFEKITKFLDAIGKRAVKMYYKENKTLKEIGEIEGLTESRISQIINKSKSEIKCRFSKNELFEEIAA